MGAELDQKNELHQWTLTRPTPFQHFQFTLIDESKIFNIGYTKKGTHLIKPYSFQGTKANDLVKKRGAGH